MYVGCDKDSGGGDGVEMGTVTVGMGKTLWAWGGDWGLRQNILPCQSLTCSKKLTGIQLSLPHETNK